MINISIVTYKNNSNIIKNNINSFIKSRLIEKLCIIDNSPADDLREIKKVDDRIEYIFNPSNPGFGAAHNVAIRHSIKSSTKYHLVLNPDVYFDESVLTTLIDYLDKNEDVGLVMPKIRYPSGEIQYLCKLLPTPFMVFIRRFMPFKNLIKDINKIYELKFTGYDKIMEVSCLSGSFMLIRVEVFKSAGLFDENIFMYFEDTDLCRRIGRISKTVYFPEVCIYHEFSKGSYRDLKLLKYHIEGAIYYFNKWGWFFDSERRTLNKKQLKKWNYVISKFYKGFLDT